MNYSEINRESWNKRTEVHFDSEFYDNRTFIEGRNALNSIELEHLKDLKGKTVLHLQCHFGQDTISLHRLGASRSVGVDLSDKAIEKAIELARLCNANSDFICCNVYDLPEHLNEQFDYVFSSYGTIGWLPDIKKWANLVAKYLKPGGKFVFAEFHPVVWMFDNNFSQVQYCYFHSEPIIEMEGTYTDGGKQIETQNISWNHGLAEVISALLDAGLQLKAFKEYDYSPYNCFQDMLEFEPGKFRLAQLGDKIPMVYSLFMEK